jgi:hypothetical protein
MMRKSPTSTGAHPLEQTKIPRPAPRLSLAQQQERQVVLQIAAADMTPARGIRAPAFVIARRRRLHESPVRPFEALCHEVSGMSDKQAGLLTSGTDLERFHYSAHGEGGPIQLS